MILYLKTVILSLKGFVRRICWSKYFPFGVLSLTVGKKVRLPFFKLPGFQWEIVNQKIKIQDGNLIAEHDQVGRQARGRLELKSKIANYVKEIPITIVPWSVDYQVIKFNKPVGVYTVLGSFDGKVYFTNEQSLYETVDGFESSSKVADLPWKQTYRSDRSLLLKTPAGWFLRTDGGVVHSHDLKSWTVAIEIGTRGMFQHLDYIYDAKSDTTYVFAAEYSTDASRRHGVYRGTYQAGTAEHWERVFEFYSSNEGKEHKHLFPSVRHIHVLTVDKDTGWVWIATGDSDIESCILVSLDKGETFKVFSKGSQKYRTLMLLFSENYLYWNMDTHSQDQTIFRIHRDYISEKHIKKLPDIRYLSPNEVIDSSEAETVANLPYGAQWYGITVKDAHNKNAIIMSASPESQVPETGEQPYRDWNARLFMIVNLESTKPYVYEVAAIPPLPGLQGKFRRYCRVDPRCQDSKGNIFFMGHNSFLTGASIGRFNDTNNLRKRKQE